MTSDRDEDALSWGDEKDPTYVETPGQPGTNHPAPVVGVTAAERRAEAARRAAGSTAAGADRPGRSVDREDGDPADRDFEDGDSTADAGVATSSVTLLAIGLLAGVYVLYSVGWFRAALDNQDVPVGAFDVVMAQVREGLSVAAPVLWFVAALLLTRRRKPIVRVLWLVLGALVLIPIPFIVGTGTAL